MPGPGFPFLIGSVLTLLLGLAVLLCTVVAGLIGGMTPATSNEKRGFRRVGPLLRGSLVCLAIGGGAYVVGASANGSYDLLTCLDHLFLAVPELGIGLGAATVIAGSTQRRVLGATSEQAEVRRGVISAALISTLVGIGGYWLSGEAYSKPAATMMLVLLPLASALIVRWFGLRAIERQTSALTPPAS